MVANIENNSLGLQAYCYITNEKNDNPVARYRYESFKDVLKMIGTSYPVVHLYLIANASFKQGYFTLKLDTEVMTDILTMYSVTIPSYLLAMRVIATIESILTQNESWS